VLHNIVLASSAQQFGKDLLRNIQDNIRKIPEVWRMMMNKLGSVFEKLPINWHKVGAFIAEYFWELLILIIALICLGIVMRFCKKVIRVILSGISLATCLYCLYIMFF
jgi:hypothetical protein